MPAEFIKDGGLEYSQTIFKDINHENAMISISNEPINMKLFDKLRLV